MKEHAVQPASVSARAFLPDERCRFRPAAGGVRVVIRLTYRCDMACEYCLAGGLGSERELDLDGWTHVLAGLGDIGAAKVLLTGGEPLVYRDLVPLVRHISRMGISVDLNTNLYRMTGPLLAELRQAGLTEISTAIEGPPEVHDRDHGRPGALARSVEAIRRAAACGIRVDASCCLRRSNLPYLDQTLAQVQELPLDSFTVSRMFPVGHGARRPEQELPRESLAAAYEHIVRNWIPRSRFPIRLTGLLGLPRPGDCTRGTSLIGLTPDGRLLPCVLMREEPAGMPHPGEAGLAAAVQALRERLQLEAWPLCCEEPA